MIKKLLSKKFKLALLLLLATVGVFAFNIKPALAEEFDNLRCFWSDQAIVVCKFGGSGPLNTGETTWDLAYDAQASKNAGTPKFKVNGIDGGYLTFGTNPSNARLEAEGKASDVSVTNVSQSIKIGDPNECGIITTGDGCDGAFDTEGLDGPGLDTKVFQESGKELAKNEDALSQCENNKSIPIGFIFCPILDGINNTVGALIGGSGQVDNPNGRQGLLVSFLRLPPINSGSTGDTLSGVMRNVITIANIFYIIIFLLLIFAGSIPFLNLDSYTIKKTLPKFIGAVILTQFAVPICGVIIDFFNIIALAIPNLVFGLSNGVVADYNTVGIGGQVAGAVGLVVGSGALIGVLAFAPVIVLILGIMALVGALMSVFYIMVRFFLLYILVILSPIAFATWVLPGTEKFFKQWWTNFIKLNAMFVTIMGLLSVSILLSRIFQNLGSGQGGNVVTKLLAGVIPIIALIMVPKTLKWTTQGMNALAAGALGAVAGAGGKAAGSLKGKATNAAKTGVGEAQNKAVATAFGAGRNKTAALLGGRLPTKKGLLATNRASAKYQGETLENNRSSMKNIGDNLRDIPGGLSAYEQYGAELKQVALGKGSKVLKASAGDVAMQKAAIAELAGRGDVGDIRDLQGTVDNSVIMQGIQPHVGDVAAKAPDIVKGPRAYETISAEKMLDLDKSSLELMIEQSKTNPTTRAALEGGARTIHSSPELRAKLSGEAIEKLNKERISGPAGSPLAF